ncbi:hypothetical protein J7E24_08980 [Hymenobacter sp. ISL-91]|uniref:hypothetical protein n=1 Tax=Hymenobacter sp. ISL-91 TaxID=2819151 RepID=UPI001BEC33B2|nr:hypothetical protein [Hymenobacter sp. ISL-91]MBT2557917.1 hypothetical protein [Hymenobacter sp. ISL-91]
MQDPKKDPQPNAADMVADGAGAAAQPNNAPATDGANPEAAIPESTQEDMGDGTGIRGGYGNSDQTNGLEGGPQTPAK